MLCFGSPTTNSLPGTSACRASPAAAAGHPLVRGEVEGDLGLQRVGVLKLVDEDALVARLGRVPHRRVVAQQVARPGEQVVERRRALGAARAHTVQHEVAQKPSSLASVAGGGHQVAQASPIVHLLQSVEDDGARIAAVERLLQRSGFTASARSFPRPNRALRASSSVGAASNWRAFDWAESTIWMSGSCFAIERVRDAAHELRESPPDEPATVRRGRLGRFPTVSGAEQVVSILQERPERAQGVLGHAQQQGALEHRAQRLVQCVVPEPGVEALGKGERLADFVQHRGTTPPAGRHQFRKTTPIKTTLIQGHS